MRSVTLPAGAEDPAVEVKVPVPPRSDGTYPPGLPVATVARVERDAAHSFAHVLCQPAAGVNRGRYLLVLSGERRLPPYPLETTSPSGQRRHKAPRAPRKKDQRDPR